MATLFAAVPAPTFAVDPQTGTVLAANDAFSAFVGVPAESLAGATAPYPWTSCTFHAASAPARVECAFRLADGRTVAAEVVRKHVGEPGEPFAVLCSVTDLSARRRLDQQLIQSGKLAAVGELAAGVAHEVNNPLFAILGLTEFLAKEVEPGSKAAERLRMIRASGEEIKEIVRALLDFARENPEERQVVPLAHVVRQAVTLMRRTNAHKGIELVPSYDDSDALVLASPNQLKQILLNLLANARQAMPAGGTVWIETSREDAHAAVVVADDGPGVPEELADRIFEPFFTTRPTSEGTGLGLSVSLGLAEANGGTLALDLDRRTGAAFILRLPLAEEGVE